MTRMSLRSKPNAHSNVRIAVIGAGLAGLSFTRTLSGAPHLQLERFEKSRGVGGRAATRRYDDALQFDHGAQYFTARDPRFRQEVETWLAAGIAEEWKGTIISLERGGVTAEKSETVRYVGVPGMSAIARHLAGEQKIHRDTRIQKLERSGEGWLLEDSKGQTHGPYQLVISTAPPLQSAELLSEHSPGLAQRIQQVEMLPCWAVLVHFTLPLPVNWNGAFVQDSPLAWIARNSSKPGRAAVPEAWVLHATPEWSAQYLELSPDEVIPKLYAAFQQSLGPQTEIPATKFITAHRWRYALPRDPLSERFLYDDQLNLAAAGDWCGGPRVEGAFLSGLELARYCQEVIAR